MADPVIPKDVPVKQYPNIMSADLGLLLPKYAERYSFVENPHWTQTELTLIWRTIPDSEYQTCVEFAYQHVLPQNYPVRRRWVKDLKIKDITYPGIWRLVNCGYDTKKQGDKGIMMTFRQGFADTLTWDEALQIEGVDLQEDERYILVVFPNVDPTKADAMTVALRATPYVSDPIIQERVHSGLWEYALVKPEKQEDGSMYIKVLLSRPQFTLTSYEHLNTPKEAVIKYLWGVPKRLAQATITSYKTGTGTRATANYDTTDGLDASTVDITIRYTLLETKTLVTMLVENSCWVTVYKDYYFGMDKAEAEALAVGTSPQGWIYEINDWGFDGDGYYYAVITRTQTKEKTEDYGDIERIGDLSVTTRTEELNHTTVPVLPDAAAGYKYNKEGGINKYCVYDFKIDAEHVLPHSDDLGVIENTVLNSVNRTEKKNQATIPTSLTLLQGHIVAKRGGINAYGVYDMDLDDDTAKAVSNDLGPIDVVADLTTTSRTEKKNQTSVAAVGTASPGYRLTIQGGLNRYGVFDLNYDTEYHVPHTESLATMEESAFKTVTRTEKKNIVAVPTLAGWGAGHILSKQGGLNAYGVYDMVLDDDVPKEITDSLGTVDVNAERTTSRTQEKNHAAIPALGSPGVGHRFSKQGRQNAYGFYDFDIDDETVLALAGTGWGRSAGTNTTVVSQEHNTTIADPGAPSTGTVKVVESRPDGYGLYNGETRTTVYSELRFYLQYASGYSTKRYLSVAHATATKLAIDAGTYLTSATDNSASGDQEDNGLLSYNMSTKTADEATGLAWTAWTANCYALFSGIAKQCYIFVKYFALKADAETWINNKDAAHSSSIWIIVDGVQGHVTDVRGPLVGQFIFEGKRVEVNWG